MKIGHIISTMDNHDPSRLLKKMNIKKSAIIINQTNEMSFKRLELCTGTFDVYNFKERGIGLSRNNGLMRSNFDITMVSDDDMEYVEDYISIIEEAYCTYSNADMLLFGVRIHENSKTRNPVKKNGRVHFLNCLRYGAVTFSFKTESVKKANISFSLLFGGGAKYSNGEDAVFIWDCLRAGFKIHSVDKVVADVYNDQSTWFEGYTDKYFKDKGALFATLSKTFAEFLCFQFVLRKRKKIIKARTSLEALRLMFQGIKEVTQNRDER